MDPPDDPKWLRTPPQKKAHCAKTKIQISQLWDLIDTWGFLVHLPLDPPHEPRWGWTMDLPLDPPDEPRWWWTVDPAPQKSTLCKNKKIKFLSFGT